MNAITEYRTREGKSRDDVAAMLNVDHATVWRWEKGELRITAERAVEIERTLGIPRANLRPDLFGDAA